MSGLTDTLSPLELVIDKKTGLVRQAGATTPEGETVMKVKRLCEQSLYAFAKFVMKRDYLTPTLHRTVANWLQRCPPQRKLLLLPREHCKTSLASHCLPCHILIQPVEHNIYVSGLSGADCRIILTCETETRAGDHLRVISAAFDSNELLRAWWPERVWENSKRQARKWNDRELIIPRLHEYPDPSVRAIGVGGAITGAHPNILIKDDLISLEAANSPIVMQVAIQWHIASRALINADDALEFIIGTRWAVGDLYQYIEENDPTVEIYKRSIVENGQPIYPEMFDLEKVARLEREFGTLFPLLYMNSAVDPSLTDFDLSEVREFAFAGDRIYFDEDERDEALRERYDAPKQLDTTSMRGMPLNASTYDRLFDRRGQWRVRAT